MERILIVDDDNTIRTIARQILESKDYECMSAADASEARGHLKAFEFHLVITDLIMPGEHGLDFIGYVVSEYPDLAVMVLTGVEDPKVLQSALDLGVYDYVIKPIEKNRIATSVFNALQRRRLRIENRNHRNELEALVEKRTEELKNAISNLEKSQEKLHDSEHKFRSFLDISKDAVYMVSKDGRFNWINQAGLELFGYDREDLSAITIRDLYSDPSEREAVIGYIEQEGSMKDLMVNFKKKDGTPLNVRLTASCQKDRAGATVGYQGFIRDITAYEQTRKNLRESEEKFRAISDSAQDAVIMMDDEGKVSYWNRSAEEIFGYPRDDAQNQDLHTLLTPKRYHAAFTEAFRGFKKTGKGAVVGKTVELKALHKGGEELPIELSLSSVKIKEAWHAIGILRDISERKDLERRLRKEKERHRAVGLELQEKNKSLLNANSELKETQARIIQQEKMASIGQLAAGVAHEINNPTGFVSSNLKTLEGYQNDIVSLLNEHNSLIKKLKETEGMADHHPSVLEQVEHIEALNTEIDIEFVMEDIPNLIEESREGTERIKKIIIDLKDFAHPGKQELVYTDINKNIESTLNIVWNEIKYKASVEKDYGELPEVQCYPQQLNQVFMNLLVNAAQAIEKQGVIRIQTQSENSHVKIRIQDTGKGIAEEDLNRIFDPFFTTKEVGKGTGLGLNVAYGIIQKHNGEIKVKSELGKGTNFLIKIPVHG